jgi:hypothetical protein
MFTKLLIKIWLKKMNRTNRERKINEIWKQQQKQQQPQTFKVQMQVASRKQCFLAEINIQNAKISFGKRFKLLQYFIEKSIWCTATQFSLITPFSLRSTILLKSKWKIIQ